MAVGGSASQNALQKIKYDVFISFRGEDTRSNFTSHLHYALCREKVKAFIDEDDLKKGNEISPTLSKAIEESKLCLVILSENYASSRWCLEELEQILRCKKTDGQAQVLPVFYKVDPSDVRKQQGSYAISFDELKKRFEGEKLQAWREALMKVADLSGWASKKFRSEAELVATIVDVVIKQLNDMSVVRDDLQGLVGIAKRIEQIESLLQIGSSDIRTIGIWGVGGIGKTTLARVVFNRLSSQFEACSFLENVREESEKHSPDHLENKLFSELLEYKIPQKVTLFEKDRLHRKKVLIIFDDVDDPQQLEQLFNHSWFGLESRIIVTSRDKQVLKNIGVNRTFKAEILNDVEAHELFSLHAFKRHSPTANKKKLSRRAVDYAGGIPLALIVLGRHLYSRNVKEWESTLDKLEKIPNKKILSVLRISYDSLDNNEKDLFLGIALCFKGEKRDLAEEILDACGLFAAVGIRVLIDKALITISGCNIIQMHALIQMMAFEIISPQSTDQDPRKGSWLWIVDDRTFQALEDDRGLQTIKGMYLDSSKLNQEISLLPTIFSKMRELRLLRISGSTLCLPEGALPFPDTLRYLKWDAYPLKSLSTSFTAEMLVGLDMRASRLETLWEGAPRLEKLKSIDLSGSTYLTQVPDLSLAPNIERVNFEFCESLIEIPSYFQHLEKLKELLLIGCSSLCNLSRLPRNLRKLQVYTVRLLFYEVNNCRGCGSTNSRRRSSAWFPHDNISSKLERFPKLSEPREFMKTLKLEFLAIKELPLLMFENLPGLERLSLHGCKKLEILPAGIHSLSSLRELNISFCKKLEFLPVLPSSISVLDARCCTSLKMVSSSIPLVKQNWGDLYNRGYRSEVFNFFGCEMLDENARKILEDEALFRTSRQAAMSSKHCLHPYKYTLRSDDGVFGWPGSDIPCWFMHKSERSSFCINLPHPPDHHNKNYLGLASCIVVEFNDGPRTIRIDLDYDMFPKCDPRWRRSSKFFNFSCYSKLPGITECCHSRFVGAAPTNIRDFMHSEYVIVFLDTAYHRFLGSNDGILDPNGNGSMQTATASFSVSVAENCKRSAKIKKFGVHLLYSQETERFGYAPPIKYEYTGSESSTKSESIHSDSQQEEDTEDENSGCSESIGSEAIYSESDQEEDEEPLRELEHKITFLHHR